MILSVDPTVRADDRPVADVYATFSMKYGIVIYHAIIPDFNLSTLRPQHNAFSNDSI